MKMTGVLLAIAMAAGTHALGSAALVAQVSQHELAVSILSESVQERHRALQAVRALGPRDTGPELRAALFAALEREGRIQADRYKMDELGTMLHDHPDPEFASLLTEVVVELNDPAAIPALAASLATGSTASRWALADFGERAAPAVVEVARSTDSWPRQADWALIVLRIMVEEQAQRPLSKRTLLQIREVARQRLHEKQTGAGLTLRKAIDLAVVLGDRDLITVVERIASDPAELRARGLMDAALIQRIQKLARDRLAGRPPLPRRP